MRVVHFLLLAQEKIDEKRRAPRENGDGFGVFRPLYREAISMHAGLYGSEESRKSPLEESTELLRNEDGTLIFAGGVIKKSTPSFT